MKTYTYDIYFTNDSHLTFETDVNIDFHALSNTAIAFPETYINMRNVNFIMKEEKKDDSISGNDSLESQDQEE